MKKDEVGTISRNRDIGFKSSGSKIYAACVDCGKTRWVTLRKGKPITDRCQSCANKKAWTTPHRRLAATGRNNKNWVRGKIRCDGYYYERLEPGDFFYPMAHKDGYTAEHRLVMARHLNRNLQSWEAVHHKNGVRDDNRIDNLELMSSIGQHSVAHNKGYRDGFTKGQYDGKAQMRKDLIVQLTAAVEGAGLTEEDIAQVLANTLGTKLKFESKLTDQDMLAFKDEMRLELHAIKEAQYQAILKALGGE